MAKKKRRESSEPEETYEFVPPEFNEREFLLKDIYGTKVLIVVSLLAVLIGIVAACFQSIIESDWAFAVGLLLIILVIVGLKQFLTLLRFRVDLMDQKMLIGNYILFFFLTLGIWIVLLNDPFSIAG
ncbi:MAG: hypothetical protein FWF40_03480 [Methanomassiliicoccaceae archaeon]|nr:hypothetical protein [Methanomassiliicoccaceae archaeon]